MEETSREKESGEFDLDSSIRLSFGACKEGGRETDASLGEGGDHLYV